LGRVGEAERARDGERLRGERFDEVDEVDSSERKQRSSNVARAGECPYAS